MAMLPRLAISPPGEAHVRQLLQLLVARKSGAIVAVSKITVKIVLRGHCKGLLSWVDTVKPGVWPRRAWYMMWICSYSFGKRRFRLLCGMRTTRWVSFQSTCPWGHMSILWRSGTVMKISKMFGRDSELAYTHGEVNERDGGVSCLPRRHQRQARERRSFLFGGG